MPEPSIYIGQVSHKRLTPFVHALDYKVFSLLLDIDKLRETASDTRMFVYNRTGVVSFHDKDHGPRDGSPLRPWLNNILSEHGYELRDCPVRLLTFPRLWGYVFNPLSIYYCYDRGGHLKVVLYEVSNTFGQWHGYLLPVTREASGPVSQKTTKEFHVSPFMPVDGTYEFTLTPPGEKLSVLIRYKGEQGEDRMIAKHTARRSDLTAAGLASALSKHPMMTFKVIAGIHWEALKLWKKGAKFHPKPDLPRNHITG
ncbi:DUF1365 domain-containing protein [Hwanghaeella grinnelliae]|uniref:DUF1365 domain-containing protein n=1 Tax=Hwanghaeella grinnelliae TaxID=2500179 RepID=A0A3S2WPU1_9PROT|nr:DUF1365 domain-containing protein [Hwanghaeella grinnelliae]